MGRKIYSNDIIGFILFVFIVFTVIMIGQPFFFQPGMFYDSLVKYFSQAPSEILNNSTTMLGLLMFVMIVLFVFFLLSSSKTADRGK